MTSEKTPAQLLSEARRVGQSNQLHPLRIARQKHGLTLEQVATSVGITEASLCFFERGIKFPSLRKAFKLAKFYGQTVDELWANIADEQGKVVSLDE